MSLSIVNELVSLVWRFFAQFLVWLFLLTASLRRCRHLYQTAIKLFFPPSFSSYSNSSSNDLFFHWQLVFYLSDFLTASSFFWHSRKEKWWLFSMWVDCVIELNDGRRREIEKDLLHAGATFPAPQTCPVRCFRRLASLHWPLKKSIRRAALRRLDGATTRTCCPRQP